MTNFPEWWFWLSGVFFVFNIVLLIGLIVALVKVVGVIKEIQPKVEQLTTKVEAVAEKVDALATTAKDAVETVGGRAKGISTSIERITQTAAVQFERFSPLLVGGLTALRLLSAVREYRKASASRHPEPEEEEDEE